MKTPSAQEIKATLKDLSQAEVNELVLRLARFKKENKELLSYLLYNASDEAGFIADIKAEIDIEFSKVNKSNLYQAKKTIRKILRIINKYCRYSNHKTTEVELRIYFCQELNSLNIGFRKSQVLLNLYTNQVKKINTVLGTLHEDLQYDFNESVRTL